MRQQGYDEHTMHELETLYRLYSGKWIGKNGRFIPAIRKSWEVDLALVDRMVNRFAPVFRRNQLAATQTGRVAIRTVSSLIHPHSQEASDAQIELQTLQHSFQRVRPQLLERFAWLNDATGETGQQYCLQFAGGHCKFGDRCRMLHPVICLEWSQRTCLHEIDCPLHHDRGGNTTINFNSSGRSMNDDVPGTALFIEDEGHPNVDPEDDETFPWADDETGTYEENAAAMETEPGATRGNPWCIVIDIDLVDTADPT